MPKNGDTVWFLDFNDRPIEGIVVGLSDTSDGDIRYRVKAGDHIFSVEDTKMRPTRTAALEDILDRLERDTDECIARLHALSARSHRLRVLLGD